MHRAQKMSSVNVEVIFWDMIMASVYIRGTEGLLPFLVFVAVTFAIIFYLPCVDIVA